MSNTRNKAAETRERKKREAEEQRIEEEQRELAEEQERIEELRSGMRTREAYNMLQSEVTGLYDEMDKLAKKAPNEPMTSLQLRIVNSFIRKAKHLLSRDTIIDEVEIFVSAGDNPEYRDVVTVLRQIRQGLDRYKLNNSFIFGDSFRKEVKEYDLEDEELEPLLFEMSDNNDGSTE
jgi:poly-D-alanine transfer protein DltD